MSHPSMPWIAASLAWAVPFGRQPLWSDSPIGCAYWKCSVQQTEPQCEGGTSSRDECALLEARKKLVLPAHTKHRNASCTICLLETPHMCDAFVYCILLQSLGDAGAVAIAFALRPQVSLDEQPQKLSRPVLCEIDLSSNSKCWHVALFLCESNAQMFSDAFSRSHSSL